MSTDNANHSQPRVRNGWFGLTLLIVIVGIELTLPAGSIVQMSALALAVAFFGSIIAWRTWH